MQKRTSKNTCTHFGHQNKVYQFIGENIKTIFDYGCGKYDDNENYCKSLNIQWFGYDPYWREEEYNNRSINYIENFGVDCIICSNVLNTIDDEETITNILENIYYFAQNNTLIIFSCYKGNGKGIGKETKPDCWQRNENYKIWIPRLEQYFIIDKRDDDVYICHKKETFRFRAKAIVDFINDKHIEVEHVVNALNEKDANKKCLETFNYYENNDRVKQYKYIPCIKDETPLPSLDFIKEKLEILNDIKLSTKEHSNAKNKLYESFRSYQPSWDDDWLSDIISYCDEGKLCELIEKYNIYYNTNEGLDLVAKSLLKQLNSEWV